MIALAHLKDGKSHREVAAALHACRHAVEQLQRERGGGRVRGEDIHSLLAGQFGVAYSLNGVHDLMKRLGMVWISARAVSPCADRVAQAEFKKNFVQDVAATLPPGVAPEQADILFLAEVA